MEELKQQKGDLAEIIINRAAPNTSYDFFAAFKQLFKESIEYKQSMKEHRKASKVMRNFETQENYPFQKFNTSRQLILFKDSLKSMIYSEFVAEAASQHKDSAVGVNASPADGAKK